MCPRTCPPGQSPPFPWPERSILSVSPSLPVQLIDQLSRWWNAWFSMNHFEAVQMILAVYSVMWRVIFFAKRCKVALSKTTNTWQHKQRRARCSTFRWVATKVALHSWPLQVLELARTTWADVSIASATSSCGRTNTQGSCNFTVSLSRKLLKKQPNKTVKKVSGMWSRKTTKENSFAIPVRSSDLKRRSL